MPKAIQMDKEQIIGHALNLTLREGLLQVTARKVAKEAKCSTQPIYSQFKDIEALKTAVIERGFELLKEVYMKPAEGEDPFLKMGMGTLRFAKEMPELYKALFITESHGLVLTASFKAHSKAVLVQQAATGKDMEDKALEVVAAMHEKLGIFTHGLALQFMGDTSIYDEAALQKQLQEAWMAFDLFYSRK